MQSALPRSLALSLCLALIVPFNPLAISLQPERHPAAALPVDETVVVTFGQPETLDPALNYETAGGEIIQQVYEPLLLYAREKTDAFVPMLADSWQISADGTSYTFHIRPEVRFHNGALLTPEDVAYSFQRGLLQGGTSSPQWLLAEPLLGMGIDDVSLLVAPNGSLYDDRAGLQAAAATARLAACQQVKEAIVADPAAGTVTFHLAQAWGPFLVTLAGAWGSVMNQAWVTAHGGWNGDCATWQDYYAMDAAADPFTGLTNGTGPYKLDHWTPGVELLLQASDTYWRAEPMWQGGPSGPAALKTILFKYENDLQTRVDMLLSGQADFASVSADVGAQLDAQTQLTYDHPDGVSAALVNPNGVLKRYTGGLGTSATDVLFNFAIQTGGPINYIGSGTLAEDGIPANFFSDLHVRKAFNYAFDWDQYLTAVFLGQGLQRHGPIIQGIPGYSDTVPIYTHNPAQAQAEFALAWGGQVAAKGFTVILTYNSGNLVRQRVAEILKANIEALNPKFHVNLQQVASSDYSADQSNRRQPLFISGWAQDIPHPHNWVVPYLIGIYGRRQSLPQAMIDAYHAKIYACVGLRDVAAQSCYEQLGAMTYADAAQIFLVQGRTRTYVRSEVRGYYLNSALAGRYYYAYAKGPQPAPQPVAPGAGTTITQHATGGATITLPIPGSAVTQTATLLPSVDIPTTGRPAGFQLGDLAFEINAFASGGAPIEHFTFAAPVTVTIAYTPAAFASLLEDSLTLFYWNGAAWEDAACGPIVRDPAQNLLQVPICHLSKFALGGATRWYFLPLSPRAPR